MRSGINNGPVAVLMGYDMTALFLARLPLTGIGWRWLSRTSFSALSSTRRAFYSIPPATSAAKMMYRSDRRFAIS